MAREQGLRFIGLSQVYPFNDWDDSRRSSVARLIETAYEAGAETISLIPRVDKREGSDAERAMTLRMTLEQILPMLQGTEIVALIEPIGFSTSSVRTQREATEVIQSIEADGRLAIIHDTFQHALAKDEDIMIPQIRLVHISGVKGGEKGLTEAQDGQRGLIDEHDKSNACNEIRALLNLGYGGPFSFECTSPLIQRLQDLPTKITESIAFVRRSVEANSA